MPAVRYCFKKPPPMANEARMQKWLDIAERDDDPPYIHDHWRLLEGCGLAERLDEEQRRFLDRMKPMYIAARYPEHKARLAATLNEEVCHNLVEQTKQLKQWILREYSAATKPSASSDATSM